MPSDIIHIAQSPDDSPSEWRFLFADLNTLNITHILQKGIVTSDQSCRYLFEMIVEALTQRKRGICRLILAPYGGAFYPADSPDQRRTAR